MNKKKIKILVISDDSKNTSYFAKTIVEALPGTVVFVADDGLEGIKLAKAQEPDVILIDISVTKEDSLKLSRIIKKDKLLQMTPMLFISDLENDRKLRLKALKAGAEAFIIKPLDDAILITQITAMAKVKERNILIRNQKKQLKELVEERTKELKKEIIERERLENELRRSEEIFKAYIEKAPIGIFMVDASGRYIGANAMACQLMQITREEILCLTFSDYLIPDFLNKGLEGFRELLKSGFLEAEYKVRNKDGHEYWINLRGSKIDDNCFIAFCSDISDRKEKEAKVEYLSYHDSLTGVYNRVFYEEKIKLLDTENNLPFSVIISDVNGLKLINDTMGHAAGDKILVETTKLLGSFLRKRDILARVGGDEFSILLPRTSRQETQEIVDQIHASCRDYKVEILKEPIALSISLGFHTKTEITESFSHVSKLAEDFMYRQKLLERESFHSALLEALKISLYERSNETQEHASRLISLSRVLGEEMELSKNELNDLELLSALHDIGKISIDNRILTKTGKLTDDEWIEMKKHPAMGYRIAMASTELRSIAEFILCHHERWDGKGYPQEISGESIPLLSRVISIVDAYDAMTNDRPYRKALTREKAIAEILKNSGSQFDPKIASLFLTLVKQR